MDNSIWGTVAGIIVSVGGAGAIITGVVIFAANNIANLMLEKYKHTQEQEIESYRTRASQVISQVERFSSQQFTQYNQLWIALVDLRLLADQIWENLTKGNLQAFIAQLIITNKAIQESAIFLEDKHYTQLLDIIDAFNTYRGGKINLFELKTKPQMDNKFEEIGNQIDQNPGIREDYIQLLNH